MASSHDEQQPLDLESGLAKPQQNTIANNNNNNSKEQHLASAESSPESAPDDSGSGTKIPCATSKLFLCK